MEFSWEGPLKLPPPPLLLKPQLSNKNSKNIDWHTFSDFIITENPCIVYCICMSLYNMIQILHVMYELSIAIRRLRNMIYIRVSRFLTFWCAVLTEILMNSYLIGFLSTGLQLKLKKVSTIKCVPHIFINETSALSSAAAEL